MADIWNDNEIQFPRLLAEINATQELDLDILAESMDLSVDEVKELFERANNKFEDIKTKAL